MLRYVLVAAGITGLIAVAVPVEASAAKAGMAGQVTCRDAAKLHYANNRKMRHAFKNECKKAYKARASASS